MREKCFYVYKIICLCGKWKDKYYIGSHYGYTDDCYTGSGKNMTEYFKLFGKNGTYKKEILEMSDNELYIKDKEREIIRKNIENDLCLNMIINAAKSTAGCHLSEEHKIKLSEAGKGKHSHMRKPFTEEHKKHISESLKGKPSWNKGIPCTEETKNKIRNANKGKKLSDETRQKLSEAGRGKKHTEEARKKMSEARKLYWQKRKVA